MAHLLGEKLKKASFSNIKETGKKVPHSPWPKAKRMKEIGMCMMVNMTGLSLFSSLGVPGAGLFTFSCRCCFSNGRAIHRGSSLVSTADKRVDGECQTGYKKY